MPASVTAFLIAVGSELLSPGREETNSVFLRSRLYDLGIPVEGVAVVSDDEMALARLLECAARKCSLVIMTGGLGPTEDDVTKKAVARFLKRSLRYDEGVKDRLENFYSARKMKMPENNLRQALVPMGSRILPNRDGTAPGIALEERGVLYLLLPGPPREMQPMFEEQVVPLLRQRFAPPAIVQRHLRLAGIPESAADQAAAPVYKKYKDVQTTILCKPGDIELIFTARGETEASVELDKLVGEIQAALGEYIYSVTGKPLEAVLGDLLQGRGLTLCVAESCTGGLLAKRLTDVPGSSAYFLGGAVCYSNALKTSMAGVPPEILEKSGAVSSTTAAGLAAGIRQRTGADASIAITGIAGPEGGTPEKPVGLVYIAAIVGEKLVVKKFHFHGDRDRVRQQSVQMAMEILRRLLLNPDKA